MRPARYIFLNQGLGMSSGKCAAQAAHAEMLAVDDFHSIDSELPSDRAIDLYRKWIDEGHYAKYVMTAEDATQMFTIERYLKERGFKTYLVIDEGRTEGTYLVPTALSVELVDKDDERTASIFEVFRSYKDKFKPTVETKPKRIGTFSWRH